MYDHAWSAVVCVVSGSHFIHISICSVETYECNARKKKEMTDGVYTNIYIHIR